MARTVIVEIVVVNVGSNTPESIPPFTAILVISLSSSSGSLGPVFTLFLPSRAKGMLWQHRVAKAKRWIRIHSIFDDDKQRATERALLVHFYYKSISTSEQWKVR